MEETKEAGNQEAASHDQREAAPVSLGTPIMEDIREVLAPPSQKRQGDILIEPANEEEVSPTKREKTPPMIKDETLTSTGDDA